FLQPFAHPAGARVDVENEGQVSPYTVGGSLRHCRTQLPIEASAVRTEHDRSQKRAVYEHGFPASECRSHQFIEHLSLPRTIKRKLRPSCEIQVAGIPRQGTDHARGV